MPSVANIKSNSNDSNHYYGNKCYYEFITIIILFNLNT